MGKVKNLEFIINHCKYGETLGYKFAHGNKMYGDYISLDLLNTTPRDLIEDINLLVRMMESCVKALEREEEANNG